MEAHTEVEHIAKFGLMQRNTQEINGNASSKFILLEKKCRSQIFFYFESLESLVGKTYNYGEFNLNVEIKSSPIMSFKIEKAM